MDKLQDDIQINEVDTKLLATLIVELNISRRNSRSYPKGHPVVVASLQKVLGIYNGLMQSLDEIVIGVTRDTLMVQNGILDKSNPVFRDFSRVLFERGIAALVLHKGLTIHELNNFNVILGHKREEILRHGGIESVWDKAHITSMTARPIRYDLISTTDEETISAQQTRSSGSIWERFARGVAQGNIGSAGDELDPELVASILNGQYELQIASEATVNYAVSIADFMRQADNLQLAGSPNDQSFEKLAAFVDRLNPELRRQFLGSTFDNNNSTANMAAQEIIPHLSADVVLETLEDINSNRISVPPIIIGMLQRLGRHSEPRPQPAAGDVSDNNDDIGKKMRTIFREHASEEFVPDEYQNKLNRIMAADQLPRLVHNEIGDLLKSLESEQVEIGISEIILQLVIAAPAEEGTDALVESLGDMCAYFLETGEYGQLLHIMSRTREAGLPESISRDLLERFSSPEFMTEVLQGLHTWGKAKFDEIREIITGIGDPFIEMLLDQLAEEGNLSIRRFMMDQLLEFGPTARQAILERLGDTRWYFLRNLLIILRAMDDPSVLVAIRSLVRHANLRVRQEALKTFLHFNDSGAELQLVNDLQNGNRDVQLAAIHMAENSRSADVVRKVLDIVVRSGFSAADYDLRSAAVRTLAEIGRVECLPELAKILGSKSLINSRQLNRLKLEIVSSLAKYPHQTVRPILDWLAKGSDEVARQAATTLHHIEAKGI